MHTTLPGFVEAVAADSSKAYSIFRRFSTIMRSTVVEAYLSRWLVEEAIRFVKQTCNLEDIRLLSWPRLKNMTGVVLLELYFICVHIGMELRLAILAGHIIHASKRFYGVTEFFYYALADGIGALLSRIRPKKTAPPPEKSPQGLLPGFCLSLF